MSHRFRPIFQLTLLALATSLIPIISKPALAADVDVVWTNLNGLQATGNDLLKTGTTGGAGDALSTSQYNGDAGIKLTTTANSDKIFMGLVYPSTGSGNPPYAIYLTGASVIQVYEGASLIGSHGTYTAGDDLEISRSGTSVSYLKNGTSFYDSLVSSTGTLLFDMYMTDNGSTIEDAQWTNVSATSPAVITDLTGTFGSGEATLTWTAPHDNGSAITDYDIEYGTVASGTLSLVYNDDASTGATVTGLTNGTAYQFRAITNNSLGSSSPSNLVFGIPGATIDVIWTGTIGVSVSGNDLTKTAGNGWANGGAVSSQYYEGDLSLEFTATETNTYRLCGLSEVSPDANYTTIDYAIYLKNNGTYAVYESGTLVGNFGSYQTGDVFAIRRIGSNIYYIKNNDEEFHMTTGVTETYLLADVAMYSNGSTITDAKFTGMSARLPAPITDLLVSDFDDQEITFTWTAPFDGDSAITQYEIEYGTVSSGTFNLTYTDDATAGATITGLTNGTDYQFRVVAKNSVGSSPVSNIVSEVPNIMEDVVWVNDYGVTISGNDLTKNIGHGWNAGATSDKMYFGNIAVFTTFDQTGKNRMIALADRDWNYSYGYLDYAVYITSYNAFWVYENGINKYSTGSNTISLGDTISIHRTDGVVDYRLNGVSLYTSQTNTSADLLVDTSLYHYTSQISDVRIAQHGGVDLNNNIEIGDMISSSIFTTTGTIQYDFYAESGDKLIIPFAPASSSFTPKLELYDPSMTLEETVITTTTGTILNYTTSTTGTFHMIVSDHNSDQTGNFSFTLQKENIPGQTIDIDFGDVVTGQYIGPVTDIDAYKFSALDGDFISLEISTTVPYVEPELSLYDSSGNLLEETYAYYSGGITGTIGYDITADGDYYLLVKEKTTDMEGYYVLTLEENLLTDVYHAGSAFDPAGSETATIYYSIGRNSDVTIKMYSPSYAPSGYSKTYYTTVLDDVAKSAGANTFVWDGKDSSGNIVPNGGYVYTIEATSGSRTALYDPQYVYGVVQIQNPSISPSNFKPHQGEIANIQYEISVPAFVHIDIGVDYEPGSPRRTLLDLDPRDDGAHSELWDGRDDDGDIVPDEDHIAVGWAVLLPDNTIIVENNQGLAVNDIVADPYAFFPVYGEITDISFTLTEAADVTLEIRDTNDTLIRTLIDDVSTASGNHAVVWDGLDESDKVPVEEGSYKIKLSVTPSGSPTTLIRVGSVTVFR